MKNLLVAAGLLNGFALPHISVEFCLAAQGYLIAELQDDAVLSAIGIAIQFSALVVAVIAVIIQVIKDDSNKAKRKQGTGDAEQRDESNENAEADSNRGSAMPNK